MTIKAIQNNMDKSFKGTFRNAMKNGYDLDTHYVIVDWKFFHKLLEKDEDNIFIKHINKHLKEGEEVICKICKKSAKQIIKDANVLEDGK